jgi:hypothetical protein
VESDLEWNEPGEGSDFQFFSHAQCSVLEGERERGGGDQGSRSLGTQEGGEERKEVKERRQDGWKEEWENGR